MAAADYYATHRPSLSGQGSPFLAPPQPQRTSSHPVYTQQAPTSNSQTIPPPPYSTDPQSQAPRPSVQFAPPPMNRPNSFSHPQRPDPSQWKPTHYPSNSPGLSPFAVPSPYQQQAYANPYQPQAAQPPPAHYPFPPQHSFPPQQALGQSSPYRPSPNFPPSQALQNPSQYSLDSGYDSDPGGHRHHRHHRHRHSDPDRSRNGEPRKASIKDSSRSVNTDSLLGAAGVGLVGDMIMPGLGAVGGALAGWWGGREYGKHRKWSEGKRDREQRDWEIEYGRRPSDDGTLHPHDHRKRSTSTGMRKGSHS